MVAHRKILIKICERSVKARSISAWFSLNSLAKSVGSLYPNPQVLFEVNHMLKSRLMILEELDVYVELEYLHLDFQLI